MTKDLDRRMKNYKKIIELTIYAHVLKMNKMCKTIQNPKLTNAAIVLNVKLND
jgi:hypothetical protein